MDEAYQWGEVSNLDYKQRTRPLGVGSGSRILLGRFEVVSGFLRRGSISAKWWRGFEIISWGGGLVSHALC